jgi:hypothetical protein
MKIIVASSSATSFNQACLEIFTKISQINSPAGLIYFCPQSCFAEFTRQLTLKYPHAKSIGATSTHLHCGVKSNSALFSVAAFSDDYEFSGGILDDIRRYPKKHIPEIEAHIKELSSAENTICLEFITQGSASEELVLAALEEACSKYDVPVAGGTADCRDDIKPKITSVAVDGNITTNQAAYMCIHNKTGKITIIQETAFKQEPQSFVITSADVERRIVLDLNGRHAAHVLAEYFNCPVEKLNDKMIRYQIGHTTSKGIFLSGFDKIVDGKSIKLGTRVYSNTTIHIYKFDDIEACTKKTIAQIKDNIPNPALVLLIHCKKRAGIYARGLYLDEKDPQYAKTDFLLDFNKMYATAFPCVTGFTARGEQLGLRQTNLSLITIAFE